MMVMGGLADLGHDVLGHGDHGGGDGDGGGGLNFISPMSMTTFASAFGAIGLITRNAFGMAPLPSMFTSIALALALDAAVLYAFLVIFVRAQSTTVVQSGDVVGMEAEVVASIPARGVGQIAYTTQSGRQTTIAKAADDARIESGRFVRVERFIGGTALVSLLESKVADASASRKEGDPQ